MYNLSNLEPKFKIFLNAENISAVTARNYLSDIRHFLGWLISDKTYEINKDLKANISLLNSKIIQVYKDHHLKTSLPVKTINRRLSALRKFFLFCQKESILLDNPGKKVGNISLVKKINKDNKYKTTPDNKINNHNPLLSKNSNTVYLKQTPKLFSYPKTFIFLVFIFLVGSFILLFKSLQTGNPTHVPIIGSTQDGKRYLTFTGKFLDSLGNPISSKMDAIFKLYTEPAGGNAIYTSSCIGENGEITPDVNGNVRLLLGSDCDGKPIPGDLFFDNPNLYLGIALGSDNEMEPRQHIPNVGYAKNSDTVQGLNIGNQSLTVPYINENGDLLVGAPRSGIRSTFQSSNFSISSAETVTIESADIGDVILQATESGTIKLRTGGFSDSYTRLTINNEGNIGIGTLFPTYGFEVNDDLKITNGNRLILASSSADPSGENGSMYYNIQSNRFRCYQGGAWTDCFQNNEKSPIGGVYNGILDEDLPLTIIESELAGLRMKIKNLQDKLDDIEQNTINSVSYLTSNFQQLTSNLIYVREKIITPVVETTRLETQEINSQGKDLVVNLNTTTPNASSILKSEEKGPLAQLIIKGLEGKTVAAIDVSGNASFSGQIAAENLLINKDATIAGNLRANLIESENISQLADKLTALEETTNASTPEVNDAQKITSELKTDMNEIQKLLADIKNQPLSNPQYYQKLDNNGTFEQLKVTGSSNLFNLSVAGSNTIGQILIENNSILSLAWDLKLSALGNIKLFDDVVIISKDGNIRTKGKVIAEAGVITNKIEALNEDGKVSINRLAISGLTIDDKYVSSASSGALIAAKENYKINGISTPALETNISTAGDALIPAQSQELIIYNNNIKDASLIYLTPKDQITNSPLSVSKQESCVRTPELNEENKNTSGAESLNCKPYFKVSINSPTVTPLAFNWLIIN